jgi:hypothetical protein
VGGGRRGLRPDALVSGHARPAGAARRRRSARCTSVATGARCAGAARGVHAVDVPLHLVGERARRRVERREPDAPLPGRLRRVLLVALVVRLRALLPRRLGGSGRARRGPRARARCDGRAAGRVLPLRALQRAVRVLERERGRAHALVLAARRVRAGALAPSAAARARACAGRDGGRARAARAQPRGGSRVSRRASRLPRARAAAGDGRSRGGARRSRRRSSWVSGLRISTAGRPRSTRQRWRSA